MLLGQYIHSQNIENSDCQLTNSPNKIQNFANVVWLKILVPSNVFIFSDRLREGHPRDGLSLIADKGLETGDAEGKAK